MCRKQPGIAIGRLCDKCDGKCPVCDSYVRPTTLVRICDECSFGNYQNKCVVCGGEVRLFNYFFPLFPFLFLSLFPPAHSILPVFFFCRVSERWGEIIHIKVAKGGIIFLFYSYFYNFWCKTELTKTGGGGGGGTFREYQTLFTVLNVHGWKKIEMDVRRLLIWGVRERICSIRRRLFGIISSLTYLLLRRAWEVGGGCERAGRREWDIAIRPLHCCQSIENLEYWVSSQA